MFTLKLTTRQTRPDELQLVANQWHEVELHWYLDRGKCLVRMNGKTELTLPIQNPSPQGISYLRVRTTAREIDHEGWQIEKVKCRFAALKLGAIHQRATEFIDHSLNRSRVFKA